MPGEGFSSDIRSSPHYQVIFNVSPVFKAVIKFTEIFGGLIQGPL